MVQVAGLAPQEKQSGGTASQVGQGQGGPFRFEQQGLALQGFEQQFQAEPQGDQGIEGVGVLPPAVHEPDHHQGVEHAGQAAIKRQIRRPPPDGGIHTQHAEQGGERQAQAAIGFQQAAEQGQGGNVPQGMGTLHMHPVAAQQAPEFSLADGTAVENEGGRGGAQPPPQADSRGGGQEGEPGQAPAHPGQAVL